jgi:hypothetical protein
MYVGNVWYLKWKSLERERDFRHQSEGGIFTQGVDLERIEARGKSKHELNSNFSSSKITILVVSKK